jgi:hypothetical protein
MTVPIGLIIIPRISIFNTSTEMSISPSGETTCITSVTFDIILTNINVTTGNQPIGGEVLIKDINTNEVLLTIQAGVGDGSFIDNKHYISGSTTLSSGVKNIRAEYSGFIPLNINGIKFGSSQSSSVLYGVTGTPTSINIGINPSTDFCIFNPIVLYSNITPNIATGSINFYSFATQGDPLVPIFPAEFLGNALIVAGTATLNISNPQSIFFNPNGLYYLMAIYISDDSCLEYSQTASGAGGLAISPLIVNPIFFGSITQTTWCSNAAAGSVIDVEIITSGSEIIGGSVDLVLTGLSNNYIFSNPAVFDIPGRSITQFILGTFGFNVAADTYSAQLNFYTTQNDCVNNATFVFSNNFVVNNC